MKRNNGKLESGINKKLYMRNITTDFISSLRSEIIIPNTIKKTHKFLYIGVWEKVNGNISLLVEREIKNTLRDTIFFEIDNKYITL
jgi:hypothetical protein